MFDAPLVKKALANMSHVVLVVISSPTLLQPYCSNCRQVFDAPPLVKKALANTCGLHRTYCVDHDNTDVVKRLMEEHGIRSVFTTEVGFSGGLGFAWFIWLDAWSKEREDPHRWS